MRRRRRRSRVLCIFGKHAIATIADVPRQFTWHMQTLFVWRVALGGTKLCRCPSRSVGRSVGWPAAITITVFYGIFVEFIDSLCVRATLSACGSGCGGGDGGGGVRVRDMRVASSERANAHLD